MNYSCYAALNSKIWVIKFHILIQIRINMKKLNFLLVIIIVALQGFVACKSDDIPPKPPPQKLLNKYVI